MKRNQASPPDPAESDQSSDKQIRTPTNQKLMASSLPEDTVAEILVKLPLKSLLRFKSSSNRIRNLIESPDFVAAHHSANSVVGLFVLARWCPGRNVASFLPAGEKLNSDDNNNLIRTFSLPFMDSYGANRMQPEPECVGSYNGLVCLIYDESRMVLWNPATSDYGLAPPLERKYRSGIRGKYIFGFGHDPISGDYKSVRISVWEDGTVLSEVLSWRQRTWTELEDLDGSLQAFIGRNVSAVMGRHMGHAVTTAGRMTWITDENGSALSFVLSTEKFEYAAPDGDRSGLWRVEKDVCVWRGSIDALKRRIKGSLQPLVGLSLVNNSGNWSKMFPTKGYTYPASCSRPKAIWSGGGDRRSAVLRHWNGVARDSGGEMFQLPFDCVVTAFELSETLVSIPGSSQ